MSNTSNLLQLIKETEAVLDSAAFYKVRQQVRSKIAKMKKIVEAMQEEEIKPLGLGLYAKKPKPEKRRKKTLSANSIDEYHSGCTKNEMQSFCAKKFVKEYGEAYNLSKTTTNAKQAEKFRAESEENCENGLNDRFSCAQQKLLENLE